MTREIRLLVSPVEYVTEYPQVMLSVQTGSISDVAHLGVRRERAGGVTMTKSHFLHCQRHFEINVSVFGFLWERFQPLESSTSWLQWSYWN